MRIVIAGSRRNITNMRYHRKMRGFLLVPTATLLGLWLIDEVSSFAGTTRLPALTPCLSNRQPLVVFAVSADGQMSSENEAALNAIVFSSEEERKKAVGNLVEDDEWQGLTMSLTELVKTAVTEDLKKTAREFLGKEDYKLGDISKEIDTRVKQEVATLRGKEDYELGDFVLAIDDLAKSMTEKLTGKNYEPGDLSIELDSRIKKAVASWSGKDEYEFGDLSREVAKRVQVCPISCVLGRSLHTYNMLIRSLLCAAQSRVDEFTGKDYEFGDISREIENRRQAWMKDVLGPEAAENYVFGDVTKTFLKKWTGNDDYQFGDITKKIMGNMFKNKK
jgi:hypothetical protein